MSAESLEKTSHIESRSYFSAEMTDSGQKPEYVFVGNYEHFPRTQRLLMQLLHIKQIKNKTIQPIGKIPLRGIFYFMLMSTCPDKHDTNWKMAEICNQNDVDRGDIQTDEERARYRDILDKFESTVFDNQSEETISQFLYQVLDIIKPYFHPDLVEMQEIDYTDIYGPIRFLQKIYTNWLRYSRQHSSGSQ